jgi:DNA-binding MarR family transcriptional regulator
VTPGPTPAEGAPLSIGAGAEGTPGQPDAAALARLEVALSALVRWSESRHIRLEVARRSGCEVQPGLMRLLEHFDLAGPMRVSDIAQCLRVDVSTVSLQLRQLATAGLVDRVADERDRRVATIVITADGRAAVARVRAARRDLLSEVFAPVGTDELGLAADVLLRVQEHMLADTITKIRPVG